VKRLLVTSATRDGSLAGPDLELLQDVIDASGLPVLAAGGIASLADLERLRDAGCEGAVLGSALWSGRVRLADALRLAAA
jgi:phosphoribosylformimino-5-aminoimidazole carboxamide ribonucleotide (ProFAR) isomerase